MIRLTTLLLVCLLVTSCAPKPPPPPDRDYQLEALQNQVRQMDIFIDNWSGYDQKYSRINNLAEYKAVKNKIFSSPAYDKLQLQEQFEGKINQFDAVVRRYEIWLDERSRLLERMEAFSHAYEEGQKQIFTKNAKPFRISPYELIVENGYYEILAEDPDQAYASARYVGLNQLTIIAASRDRPLRQSKTLENGSNISRSYREYLVKFSDEVKNKYQFAQAIDVTNKDSENGIRPGEHAVWTYRFNPDNHPVETVNTFQIIYPQKVFGKPLRLSIPLTTITIPTLPDSLTNRQP